MDLLRIFCAFLVIVLHSAVSDSLSSDMANTLTRCSVPVFVLLSGYYMLARDHGIRDVLRRSLRLFLLIVSWSAIYALFELLNGRGPDSVSAWLNYLLGGPIHMWYLWTLMGLYALTPILRSFHRSAGKTLYRYALFLFFLIGSPVYLLQRIEGVPAYLQVLSRYTASQLGFLFCYLLGGYYRKFGCTVESRRGRLYMAALFLLCVAWKLLSAPLFRDRSWYVSVFLSFYAPSALLMAALLFRLTRSCLADRAWTQSPLLRELAADALGVYLIHYLFVMLLQRHEALRPLFYFRPSALSLLLRSCAVFLLSVLTVSLLRRIPILRKLAAK